jgi:hypothetical protein
MKRFASAAGFAALAAAVLLCTAAKAVSDRDTLLGTWYVTQGIYTDGTLEKELEMQFTFTKATMTNPMSENVIAYTLDEKAKTITAKEGDSTVWFRYAITDGTSMKFTAMTVTTAKGTTAIVGDTGTFKELDLKKKP